MAYTYSTHLFSKRLLNQIKVLNQFMKNDLKNIINQEQTWQKKLDETVIKSEKIIKNLILESKKLKNQIKTQQKKILQKKIQQLNQETQTQIQQIKKEQKQKLDKFTKQKQKIPLLVSKSLECFLKETIGK